LASISKNFVKTFEKFSIMVYNKGMTLNHKRTTGKERFL